MNERSEIIQRSTEEKSSTIEAMCKQIDEIGAKATSLIDTISEQRDAYRDALIKLVDHVNECRSDSEGRWPQPESWCIECTVGTVPDRLNTGLCAHHGAEKLLNDNPPKVNYGQKR